MKLKLFALLFFLLFTSLSFTQNTASKAVFIDENLNEIDKASYLKKCEHITNKCLEYKTDSLTVHKILNKYYFGDLGTQGYDQIRLLLNRDSKKKIDSGEVIVLKYYDSLLSFSTLNKRHIKHTLAVKNDTTLSIREKGRKTHVYNKKKSLKNRSKWVKKQNKCIEKYEKKFPIKINYLYKAEENIVNAYNGFIWVKDNGVFKNKFFKIMYNYNLAIIKPDGAYYLNGGHTTDKKIEALLKTENWEAFKSDLELSKSKYIINGYGLFNKIAFDHNTKHCF
jgi:hypothetical protein